MQESNKMATMPMGRLLLTMAVPLMLSLVVQSLYNIVDSIFVARLSETALTATSLVFSVQFLMIAVSVGTAVGLNALVSRLLGRQDTEGACRVATTGLWVTLVSALVFSQGGMAFSGPFSRRLTPDPDLARLCSQYMWICTVFFQGIFLQTYGQRLLQSVGDTVYSMVSLVIGAVLNILLDPIMIFGLLGFPALGIEGAAIATVIGQWVGTIAALGFNRWRNPSVHVWLSGYRFQWREGVWKELFTSFFA